MLQRLLSFLMVGAESLQTIHVHIAVIYYIDSLPKLVVFAEIRTSIFLEMAKMTPLSQLLQRE